MTHWRTGAHGNTGIDEVGGGLGHPAAVARRTQAAPFAGEGDQKIVPSLVAMSPREAVGQNAAG